MTEQIFISYSKKDSDFANKLADDLSAAGFKIWIDRSIGGGDLWRETIEKNLKAAGEVIIVVSPNSMASEWVKHEGSLAYGWGKKLYPILIEKVSSLPPWLEEYQWLDFVNTKHEAAFNALVAALTPPNPIQDLLDQQVQVCRQTGDLISEAILRVVNENRGMLVIDDEAQELIARSQHVIDERRQRERQLIAEKEEARRSELQKVEQIRQLELYVARKKAEEAEEQRRLEEIRAQKAESEARKVLSRSNALRRSLVASVVLLIMTLIGSVWYVQLHKPLAGDLNIAVAQFMVIDKNGINVSKKSGSIGNSVANQISKVIENEISQVYSSGLTIEIASPNKVGVIDGENLAEMTMNVSKLAKTLNADIVFYGSVTESDNGTRVSPHVYFRALGSSENGEMRLFQIALNNLSSWIAPNDLKAADIFTINAHIAQQLIPAIDIYLAEAYFVRGDFQRAIELLNAARQTSTREGVNAETAYIYVLLGNTYLLLARQEDSEDNLRLAEAHFQTAVEINPENPWAVLGLGDTNYLKALSKINNNVMDNESLKFASQAADAYQVALDLTSTYQNADYETIKAYFGQGQVRLVEALMSKEINSPDLEEAKMTFEEIINVYENGNKQIKDLACHAKAHLGMIAKFQNKYDNAVNYYNEAISICDFEFYKAYYSAVLGDLYTSSGKTDEAINAYNEAINYEPNPETKKKYEEKLNALTGN